LIIIHTSDLHLVPSNLHNTVLEEAYYEVLNEIKNIILNQDSKYLVIPGDFFDDDSVHYDILIKTARILRELREKGVRVVVSHGNHDIARGGSGVLDLLASVGLIHLTRFDEAMNWLILHPLVFEDDKIVFYGVPGFRGSSNKEVEYFKQGTTKFNEASKYRDYIVVVLAHIQTKFYGYDPSRYSWRYGSLYLEYDDFLRRTPENTKYIALGHLHLPIPQEEEFKSKAAYPGAPIGIDVNDFRETYELLKKKAYRRVLMADLSSDIPVIKAIKLENTPIVHYYSTYSKSIEELRNQIKQQLLDIELGKYTILLVDVESDKLTSQDIAKLNHELNREVKEKKSTLE